MEKISIKFNSITDKTDVLEKKQEYIKNILGNDLDLKIVSELNKKNNLLKRFCRRYAVLDYQIKIDYDLDENDILFYDMVMNNTFIHFDESENIFDYYIPSDYIIKDKITGSLIMNGLTVSSDFCKYLTSKFVDIVIERTKISDSEYKINSKKELNHCKIAIVAELDTLDTFGIVEANLNDRYLENISNEDSFEVLKFLKYALVTYAQYLNIDVKNYNFMIESLYLINYNSNKLTSSDNHTQLDDDYPIENVGLKIVADESDIEDLKDSYSEEIENNPFVSYTVFEDFLFNDLIVSL